MGTSSTFGGPGGNTALVPSWLEEIGSGGVEPDGNESEQPLSSGTTPVLPEPSLHPPIPPAGAPGRYLAARNNFSRFASSGGTDRASLGRAVSGYVRTASGSARAAAARMGSSRSAGSRLLGFLSNSITRGAGEALRALNLSSLAGRTIEEIFLGLADYICPEGGSIDEGIARNAFYETITDLAAEGVTDLDGLTTEQMQVVFELYATNAIEARLCNDIGSQAITLPMNTHATANVQAQLHDFIRRGVSDALTAAHEAVGLLTQDRVLSFVSQIYEMAFDILKSMGDREAEQ
jgi:hypothetical protein